MTTLEELQEDFTESSGVLKANYGKTIRKVSLEENALRIAFSDFSVIKIFDEGQQCCEERYMVCEDELDSLLGQKLISVEVKSYEDQDTKQKNVYRELAFVEVQGDKSSIQLVNYNEHNGYYEGFNLVVKQV